MSMRLKEIESPDFATAVANILPPSLNDISEDMNQYTKYLSGDTERSVGWRTLSDTRGVIYWSTEYAAYAYYTGKPSMPGRQLRWAEYAARRHGNEWGEDIKKRIEKAWKR